MSAPLWRIKPVDSKKYDKGMPECDAQHIAYFVPKGERLVGHTVMVRDCADGSHVIMDALIINGHDRKTKKPTARGVLRVGRRAALAHAGDYKVTAAEVLSYTPICYITFEAEQIGEYPAGATPKKKDAHNKIYNHIWKIFRQAKDRNFWLATLGKRSLKAKQVGIMPGMKYWGIVDNWRIPANKAKEYHENIRQQKAFKKSSAWVFESIETASGEVA